MIALVRKDTMRIRHINGGKFGVLSTTDPDILRIPIPDQDVSHLYRWDEGARADLIREAYYPRDVVTYTSVEQAAIDAPRLAREELSKTAATSVKDLGSLVARVALIEKVLGI